MEIMESVTKTWNLVKLYQKYLEIRSKNCGQNFLEFQSLKLLRKSGILTFSDYWVEMIWKCIFLVFTLSLHLGLYADLFEMVSRFTRTPIKLSRTQNKSLFTTVAHLKLAVPGTKDLLLLGLIPSCCFIYKAYLSNSAPPSKNAVSAFQISSTLLSFLKISVEINRRSILFNN